MSHAPSGVTCISDYSYCKLYTSKCITQGPLLCAFGVCVLCVWRLVDAYTWRLWLTMATINIMTAAGLTSF